MNKGDLVELSAYGKKLKMLSRFKNDVGIVVTGCRDDSGLSLIHI